jgi:hypothetical protein
MNSYQADRQYLAAEANFNVKQLMAEMAAADKRESERRLSMKYEPDMDEREMAIMEETSRLDDLMVRAPESNRERAARFPRELDMFVEIDEPDSLTGSPALL